MSRAVKRAKKAKPTLNPWLAKELNAYRRFLDAVFHDNIESADSFRIMDTFHRYERARDKCTAKTPRWLETRRKQGA